MGVSKFHAWLVEQFGSAASDARGRALAADHVVVDMTSVVQSAARRCKSGREAVKRVVGRVESIFTSSKTATTHSVCRARTSVGFFLDGPLPRAKVVTVRQRRLKAKDGVRADGLVTERGARRPSPNRIPPFDVLEISPGTDFSERLAEALGQWAEKRTRRNAAARQGFDEVVVSDASVPGDGEVKCVKAGVSGEVSRRLKRGDCFGELAIVDAPASYRSATVATMGPTELLKLSQSSVHRLLSSEKCKEALAVDAGVYDQRAKLRSSKLVDHEVRRLWERHPNFRTEWMEACTWKLHELQPLPEDIESERNLLSRFDDNTVSVPSLQRMLREALGWDFPLFCSDPDGEPYYDDSFPPPPRRR